jgi:hypothetical protein
MAEIARVKLPAKPALAACSAWARARLAARGWRCGGMNRPTRAARAGASEAGARSTGAAGTSEAGTRAADASAGEAWSAKPRSAKPRTTEASATNPGATAEAAASRETAPARVEGLQPAAQVTRSTEPAMSVAIVTPAEPAHEHQGQVRAIHQVDRVAIHVGQPIGADVRLSRRRAALHWVARHRIPRRCIAGNGTPLGRIGVPVRVAGLCTAGRVGIGLRRDAARQDQPDRDDSEGKMGHETSLPILTTTSDRARFYARGMAFLRCTRLATSCHWLFRSYAARSRHIVGGFS